LRSNEPVYKFSVFEDKHRGNTLNLKLGSRAWILVDIQLGHAVTPIRLGSELFHDWSNHATWSTPGSPAIQQYWGAIIAQDLMLKGSIRNDQRLRFRRSFHSLA